jgi:hypothetical protein
VGAANHRRSRPIAATFLLRKTLQDFKSTHAIVWGITNWHSIDAGEKWTDGYIPDTEEPYCTTTVDGHTTFFTRVLHPSSGFSSKRWAPVLSRFFKLKL